MKKDKIIEFLNSCKLKHHYCEDSWYSCPKEEDGCCDEDLGDECNCGAYEHNKKIDDFIKLVNKSSLL